MNLFKRSKYDIALVLVSTLIALVTAEFSVRVYLFGLKGLSYRWVESVHNLRYSGLIQPASAPGLLFELKPNVRDYLKLVHMRTNSVGLREDKEYAIKKEPGVFRVAVIGDSLTMPLGVELDDAYFKIIENKLNAKGNGRRYEFINFAVAGYSPRQYAAVIEHKALKYHPDLVLIGWCAANDHEDLPDLPEKNHAFSFSYLSGFFKSYLMDLHSAHLQHAAGETGQETEEYTKAESDYISEMFGKIKNSVGKKPVLIAFLGFHEKGGTSLQALAKPFGFRFVSVIPAFNGIEDQSDYMIYKLDSHPNAKAQRIFADVIYAEILKQSLF